MWKPNASRLSYNLVVILLFLSRMNGTSFYNWPKFSETANKVVNVSFPLNLKN